jgi:hypothetical protein
VNTATNLRLLGLSQVAERLAASEEVHSSMELGYSQHERVGIAQSV